MARLIHPREFLLRQRNQIALLSHRLETPLPVRLRETHFRQENLASRLDAGLFQLTRQSRTGIERLADRLIHPREFLLRNRNALAVLSHRLQTPPATRLSEAGLRVENLGTRLNSVSYQAVLQRGFVLVTSPKGAPILSSSKVKPGDALKLKFHDGEIAARAAPQQGMLDL